MTPEFVKWLTDLPFTALLTLAIGKLYLDSKSERAQMLVKLDKAVDECEKIKERMMRIEWHLGIDDPPTLPKPPAAPITP